MSFPTTQYKQNPAPIVVPYVWSDASGGYIPQRESTAVSFSLSGASLTVDQVGISGGQVSLIGDNKVGITGEVFLGEGLQLELSGQVGISGDVLNYNPTGINFGQLTLAGTPVKVSTPSYDGYVYLKAHSGNANLTVVGGEGVGGSDGYPLYPQDEILIPIDGSDKIYVSGQGNDIVSYIITH